ncbi:retrovirus-related pol polyprotein from transposon TNT 1-94 [Tanacetum coccineum]
MSENEDKYHDTVLDLEAKLKKNVDLILKLGNSLQGMFMLGPKPLSVYDQQLKHGLGYPNPYTLKQAISQCPKLYLASSLGNSEISLNVRDTEDTLDDASKSQQKVYEKMNDPIAVANKQNCWTIDYAQINALYKDFVPQKELSAEQKYFPSSFIPSDKNSNATPSIPASMPKSELCKLEKQNDFLKDQLLEVSLKHEVELSVLLNHECVDNSLHAEIEQLKKKSIKIQEGLQARIKILEKDVQRCEKQSVDFELKLQHVKEKHKWDSNLKNKDTNPLDYSWILKMEKFEDENVSLDFTIQSLIKEHDNNLLFAISKLKTRLANVEKGKSVNTKFDNTNGSQPLLCVTPLHKHVIQKKTDVQKSEENHAVSKPVTLQTLPAKQRGVNSNKNVIAPGMYKVVTTHESQTNEAKHDLSSTGMNAASSVRRPMNRDSHVKNSVLANSKKPAKKVAVYVTKNKQTYNTSKNVISKKENVIDVDVANASKAKTLLCVSCMKNVLIPCHANCFANYKLNVHSNVRRTLSTKSRKSYDTTYVIHKTRFTKEPNLSKSLDTTYVVSKPKIDVGSTSKANDKVSSTKKRNLRDKSLRTYMKNKIRTSRIWQKWFESKPNVVWSAVNTKPNGQNSSSSEKQSISVKKWVVKFPTYPCGVYSCVIGLGHNLFSVGQFCDGDLEVAFCSKTCYVRNLEGDDLLTGGRESNLYTISISDMAAFSPVCLMSKATLTKSWLWHHRLSHLNFGTINYLTRLDMVDGLPKFKYGKDHLCSACDRGKRKKASHPLKLVPSDHSKLELLYMDLCGPMRVASINGKKYIFVIVDDYSRYTWVYFLHSKDETPEIIKKFIAQAQLNYKAKVYKIRTDNGTKFKNETLKSHYEKLGIMQQFSTAQTPQQNGVVERRNRTLVEATHTRLIFTRLPEFLWAEVVATACFTQNQSIIHTRHIKTPYELLRGRKPNVEYFHMFGSLCYPTNDRDDLGKMKPKADIGVFIGYSETSRGFRIYNRRTKKIMETIHVKFDELTAMASEHDYLDNLFGPMYEEYFDKKFSDTPINSAAQATQIHEDLPTISLIIVDEHEAPLIFVPYNPLSQLEIESSTTLEPSNVQNFHQVQPSTHIWTKDNPLDQVIGDPSKPVMTRQWLHTDSKVCMYALTVITIEPKNIKEAMADHKEKNIIALKWLWKNKCDAKNIVVRVTPPNSDMQRNGNNGSPPVRRALSSRLRLQHLKKGRVQRKDSDISSGIGLYVPKYTQLLAESSNEL